MPRSPGQRRADLLAQLTTEPDVWVASASERGDAHLIPLTFSWDGARLTVATPERNRIVRDLRRAGWARMALPSTREVAILEGPLEFIAAGADDALAAAHAAAGGFDARDEPEPYVLIRLTPARVLAWRDVEELAGRVIMRDGQWVADVPAPGSD